MKTDEALKIALDELSEVQFTDNTAREATRERAEVERIIRELFAKLTTTESCNGPA